MSEHPALANHQPMYTSPDKPWKTGCQCGEWWYDFDHHRRRVIESAT